MDHETEREAGAPSGEGSEGATRRRVARVLEQVKAGVKQRQAERATVPEQREETRLALLELRQSEFVREPQPVSPRPLLGPLLVFLRKAAYHLFFKWHARAALAQQNSFNQTAARLIEELVHGEESLRRELARLRRRLAELEDRREGTEEEGGEPGEVAELPAGGEAAEAAQGAEEGEGR